MREGTTKEGKQMTEAATPIAPEAEIKAIGATGVRYSMEQLGMSKSREELIAKIADAPKAGIIFISGYEAKHGYGEVADYVYLKGINYANMKTRSLAKLDEIEANVGFTISIHYKAYFDADGREFSRKAKGRVLRDVRNGYEHGDATLSEAIAKVRNSLENPRQNRGAEYDSLGNGIYSHEGTLHIRDCLIIRKTVIIEGEYPEKATSELVALTAKLKSLMPISKYRQVCLDGRFDYIAVNGELVLQSEGGRNIYVAFKELKGNIGPRIIRSDDAVQPDKIATAVRVLQADLD